LYVLDQEEKRPLNEQERVFQVREQRIFCDVAAQLAVKRVVFDKGSLLELGATYNTAHISKTLT
jgi:hypothetical protein